MRLPGSQKTGSPPRQLGGNRQKARAKATTSLLQPRAKVAKPRAKARFGLRPNAAAKALGKAKDLAGKEKAAKAMGIEKDSVTILIHCGSRGFGHQVCSDYLRISEQAQKKYDIHLADRELACVPNKSEEGESYRSAMFAALNFAWSNRQMISHWTRKSFQRVFKQSESDLDMKLVYDVAHNIAKVEKHKIDGKKKRTIHKKNTNSMKKTQKS